jgi:hypothetical protein
MTERPDRTNLIVGAVVEWTSFGGHGVSEHRGRVLDSQLSKDEKYQLLVEPKQISEGSVNGWRDVCEHESRLITIEATDAHVPKIDEGTLPGKGYR